MSSTDSQQRQIELLEAIQRDVRELSTSLKAHGRVSESVVRAVTNLGIGLKEHADEHYRWMKLQTQRHDEVMGGLVETIVAAPKKNGAQGTVSIETTKPARGDVSASITIGESRVEISEQHFKIAKERGLRWALALLGMAASAGATWLAGHIK